MLDREQGSARPTTDLPQRHLDVSDNGHCVYRCRHTRRWRSNDRANNTSLRISTARRTRFFFRRTRCFFFRRTRCFFLSPYPCFFFRRTRCFATGTAAIIGQTLQSAPISTSHKSHPRQKLLDRREILIRKKATRLVFKNCFFSSSSNFFFVLSERALFNSGSVSSQAQ